MGRFVFLLLAILAIGAAPQAASAQDARACDAAVSSKRVALVIGNGAYAPFQWSRLDNPVSDAEAVCRAFAREGFRVVRLQNGTRAQMGEAIAAFVALAQGADTALFYYAGHGFEYAGINYLVPVDAPIATSRARIGGQFIDLAGVLSAVKLAKHGLVFLDACRTRDAVVRIADADLDGPDGAPGTINLPADFEGVVFYSTARGSAAFDAAPVDAPNSPFAQAVVDRLEMPDLELMRYFAFVRSDVKRRTGTIQGGPQVPTTYGFLGDEFYFNRTPDVAACTLAGNCADAEGTTRSGAAATRGFSLRARTGAVRQAAPATATPGPTGTASFAERLRTFDPGKASSALAAIDARTFANEDEPQILARVLADADVASLVALADQGDVRAGYLYGVMLYLGLGVPQDLARARGVLGRAAESKAPAALLEYGYFLEHYGTEPTDKTEASRLYEAAVAGGYSKAQAHLAYRLWNAAGAGADKPRALALWQAAAAQGYPYAIYATGVYGGRMTEAMQQLTALAVSGDRAGDAWLCQLSDFAGQAGTVFANCLAAARDGFSGAMGVTARLYATGQGTALSHKEAEYWGRLALAQPDFTDAANRAALQSWLEKR